MNLPNFSFRSLVYFLFGLVVLILLAEGGYYFYLKKESFLQLQDIMNL